MNIKQCSARGASRMITNTISGSLSSPTEDRRRCDLIPRATHWRNIQKTGVIACFQTHMYDLKHPKRKIYNINSVLHE